MKWNVKLYLCNDDDKKIVGRGPVQLLKDVDELKSIKKAADKQQLSFNKALNMIHVAEDELGCKLLDKRIGGEGGGGSVLTDEAYQLIEKYTLFEEKAIAGIQAAFNEVFGEDF